MLALRTVTYCTENEETPNFIANPYQTPSRLVSGLCGGIGGVAPDGDGCFAAIKPAPGMNAGYVLRKPLTAFASWKTGFCCARCCAVGVVGQGAGVLGGLSAPSGGLTRGGGSRREAVGDPRRGSPAFRPLAAVSFPQRLSQGDVKEFIKLKTARARYGVRKALSHKAFKVVRVGETTKAACVKPRANPQASVCESTCQFTRCRARRFGAGCGSRMSAICALAPFGALA